MKKITTILFLLILCPDMSAQNLPPEAKELKQDKLHVKFLLLPITPNRRHLNFYSYGLNTRISQNYFVCVNGYYSNFSRFSPREKNPHYGLTFGIRREIFQKAFRMYTGVDFITNFNDNGTWFYSFKKYGIGPSVELNYTIYKGLGLYLHLTSGFGAAYFRFPPDTEYSEFGMGFIYFPITGGLIYKL
jgi:hypothetical protein